MWCDYEEIVIRQSWTRKSSAVPAESFKIHSGVHSSREGTVI